MTDPAPIRYTIVPSHPAAHLYEVTCTVADPDPVGQRFALPAWIPGSYMIREFARNIVDLRCTAQGRDVGVRKIDKDTWQCDPCAGPLQVIYHVYAWDLSVRAAHLDTTHAYFNGTSVFLQAVGATQRRCEVDIQPPAGPAYAQWRVATAMARADAVPYGFGRYSAADYDELVDHPVEMGDFALASFEACGVPHDVVITGRQSADLARLCDDMRRICEHHMRFFGEPAPMARYVFLVLAVGEGYGGLEHRASTSLLCARNSLPLTGVAEVGEDYRSFLGLVSHEYFHTWNVKRIKPAAFLPYDLSREAYTRQLWAFEGITSYYDDLALVRSGLIDVPTYLQLLGETATRVWRGSGRLKQSLADSSFDAWTKFYRQDENAPNAIVSYYTKGALVALALDLTLRRGTAGRVSLDDVMRTLWERHGKPLAGVAEGAIEKLAGDISGLALDDFFERALRGTGDLPLGELLASVGIEFHLRPAESDADKGGKAAKKSETELRQRAVLGARLADGASEAKLAQVHDAGAAQAAGLSAGDVLVALNGIKVTRANLEKLLARHRVGERVAVHAFRRDELLQMEMEFLPPVPDTCVLSARADVPPDVAQQRRAWLGRDT
jgi:predicted metalloprotease with PDZ domain